MNPLLCFGEGKFMKKMSCFRKRKSPVYLNEGQLNAIQESQQFIQDIHDELIKNLEEVLLYKYINLENFERIFRISHFRPFVRNHQGNTVGSKEYFQLFEVIVKSIGESGLYSNKTAKKYLFEAILTEVLPILKSLSNVLNTVQACITDIKDDIPNVKTKYSLINSKFDDFSRKFFNESSTLLNKIFKPENNNEILIITRLFFVKYFAVEHQNNDSGICFDKLCERYNLSQSLMNFLIADSYLTGKIREIRYIYNEIKTRVHIKFRGFLRKHYVLRQFSKERR